MEIFKYLLPKLDVNITLSFWNGIIHFEYEISKKEKDRNTLSGSVFDLDVGVDINENELKGLPEFVPDPRFWEKVGLGYELKDLDRLKEAMLSFKNQIQNLEKTVFDEAQLLNYINKNSLFSNWKITKSRKWIPQIIKANKLTSAWDLNIDPSLKMVQFNKDRGFHWYNELVRFENDLDLMLNIVDNKVLSILKTSKAYSTPTDLRDFSPSLIRSKKSIDLKDVKNILDGLNFNPQKHFQGKLKALYTESEFDDFGFFERFDKFRVT